MLDFKELPKDGTDLERLVREIFIREGYETKWTGKGADGGRDLIVIEKLEGPLSEYERTWLVQCKHKAHSGESVGSAESNSIITDCRRIKATGYLLVCTTQPSSGLMQAYDELQSEMTIKYWDSVNLENILLKPCNFPLIHTFFPVSSKSVGWRIYNTNSPSFWAANYKHSFFYLSARLGMKFDSFRMVQKINKLIEDASEKSKTKLELRAIYYDDKYTNYKAYIDQLIEKNDNYNPFSDNLQTSIERFIKVDDGYIPIDWDIKTHVINSSSDSFHPHEQGYYEPYLNNYKTGSERPGAITVWS